MTFIRHLINIILLCGIDPSWVFVYQGAIVLKIAWIFQLRWTMLASNLLNSSYNCAFFGNLGFACYRLQSIQNYWGRGFPRSTYFLFITHSLTWTRPQSGAWFAWLVSFKISDSSIEGVTVALHQEWFSHLLTVPVWLFRCLVHYTYASLLY